jgi:hypothetical protein
MARKTLAFTRDVSRLPLDEYTRLSVRKSREVSTGEQHAEIQECADEENLILGEYFSDPDKSAAYDAAARPEWTRLMRGEQSMPVTPAFRLPYPSASDVPDVPGDMQRLAEATNTALLTLSGLAVATAGTTGYVQGRAVNGSKNKIAGAGASVYRLCDLPSGARSAPLLPEMPD